MAYTVNALHHEENSYRKFPGHETIEDAHRFVHAENMADWADEIELEDAEGKIVDFDLRQPLPPQPGR